MIGFWKLFRYQLYYKSKIWKLFEYLDMCLFKNIIYIKALYLSVLVRRK
jgi:hypothetical protein